MAHRFELDFYPMVISAINIRFFIAFGVCIPFLINPHVVYHVLLHFVWFLSQHAHFCMASRGIYRGPICSYRPLLKCLPYLFSALHSAVNHQLLDGLNVGPQSRYIPYSAE